MKRFSLYYINRLRLIILIQKISLHMTFPTLVLVRSHTNLLIQDLVNNKSLLCHGIDHKLFFASMIPETINVPVGFSNRQASGIISKMISAKIFAIIMSDSISIPVKGHWQQHSLLRQLGLVPYFLLPPEQPPRQGHRHILDWP